MKDKDRIETSYWSNGDRRCKATYINNKIHGL